jgi:hypothetical protein
MTLNTLDEPNHSSLLKLPGLLWGVQVDFVVDSGAALEGFLSADLIPAGVPVDVEAKRLVKVGDGRTIWTASDSRAEVILGGVPMLICFTVMPTTAFKALLGIRFLRRREISGLSFHPPTVRIKDTTVPLLITGNVADVLTFLTGKSGGATPMEGLESYRVNEKIRASALSQLSASVRVDFCCECCQPCRDLVLHPAKLCVALRLEHPVQGDWRTLGEPPLFQSPDNSHQGSPGTVQNGNCHPGVDTKYLVECT